MIGYDANIHIKTKLTKNNYNYNIITVAKKKQIPILSVYYVGYNTFYTSIDYSCTTLFHNHKNIP